MQIQKPGQKPQPRILIYGAPGAGKTTWATSSKEKTVVLDAERGAVGSSCDRVAIDSWPLLMDTLAELINDRETHDYGVVVIDSLSAIEGYLHTHVAKAAGKDSIADLAYGKGYATAASEMARVLKALDILSDMGATTIVVAHESVSPVMDPTVGEYHRFAPSADKRVIPRVIEWSDIIARAVAHEPIAPSTDGARVTRTRATGRSLVLEPSAAVVAKVRAGWSLPPRLELDRATFEAALRGELESAAA